ncbi:MAG TPA: universal stress protein [Candidatus Obscuribacterales bacterium]
MQDKSILLAVDGSVQAHWAAELCLALSERYNTRVTAQHVVDSVAIWEFLAHDLPGLIGSGPYMAAFEPIRTQLVSIGQTLLQVYENRCQSRGLTPETVLDEGSYVPEICRRARAYDLVAVGHKRTNLKSLSDERRRFVRHSLAEKLSHYCTRPLLIVQESCEMWTSISIIVSARRDYSDSISRCADLARYLSLPMRIVYWKERAAEEDGALHSLVQQKAVLKDVFPELVIEMDIIQGPLAPWLPNIEFERDTLVTIPALPEPGTCMTPFGVSSDMLVRYCGLPCLLLWLESREETTHATDDAQVTRQAMSSGGSAEQLSWQLRQHAPEPSAAASV